MSQYLVAVVTTIDGFVNFLLQSMGHDVEADEYSANDENGNTAVITHINHRIKISVNAKIPTNVSIPIPGQIVKVAGIVLPTVDEHGVVTGSFKIDKTQTTKYDFVVTGNPNATESNSDYNNCTFELTRYLVNGLPSAGSDSN